jgi:hypothetical protein
VGNPSTYSSVPYNKGRTSPLSEANRRPMAFLSRRMMESSGAIGSSMQPFNERAQSSLSEDPY